MSSPAQMAFFPATVAEVTVMEVRQPGPLDGQLRVAFWFNIPVGGTVEFPSPCFAMTIAQALDLAQQISAVARLIGEQLQREQQSLGYVATTGFEKESP